MRYRERLRRLKELGNVPRPIRYPEGPRLKSRLISHAHGLRILVSEEELAQYFGNERCWMKLGIKGKTLIRQYDPNSTREFYISKGLGEIGEEVEISINKLSLVEFVTMAIKGGRSSFSVEVGQPGNYHLVIGNERISMTLAMDLHFERGSLKGRRSSSLLRITKTKSTASR